MSQQSVKIPLDAVHRRCTAAITQHTSQRETMHKSHHDAAPKPSQDWQLVPHDSTIALPMGK
jgi:hypothetical protein